MLLATTPPLLNSIDAYNHSPFGILASNKCIDIFTTCSKQTRPINSSIKIQLLRAKLNQFLATLTPTTNQDAVVSTGPEMSVALTCGTITRIRTRVHFKEPVKHAVNSAMCYFLCKLNSMSQSTKNWNSRRDSQQNEAKERTCTEANFVS